MTSAIVLGAARLILACVFVSTAHAQASTNGAAAMNEEEVVKAVTQRACDAFLKADAASLDALLAPTFTLVGTDGSVQPRSQAFAEVAAKDPAYEVFRNHDMVAHVYGDAATVQGITSLKGTSGGKPFALDVRFTDTLVRINGQWRIVVSHVTRLPGS